MLETEFILVSSLILRRLADAALGTLSVHLGNQRLFTPQVRRKLTLLERRLSPEPIPVDPLVVFPVVDGEIAVSETR